MDRTDIVEVNSDAVNRYRELSSLAPLGALLLAEDLAGAMAAGAIGAIEWARKRLQHIWRVDLEFGRHLKVLWLRIDLWKSVSLQRHHQDA